MSPAERAEFNAMHASYRKPMHELSEERAEAIRADSRRRYAELSPEDKLEASRKSWRHRLKRYGITVADYDAMVERQGNRCACCGATSPGANRVAWLVDHDHTTNAVRGLLCYLCNTGIGMLGDDLDGVLNAVAYLQGGSRW